MPEILDVCRDALRRSSKALDETELLPLIEAAKIDIEASGVRYADEDDPLLQAAIRLYVLAMVERDDRLMAFYESTKNGMAMNSRYAGGE